MKTKFKIIETNDYILAVSDGEIKEGDYCINFFKSNDYIDAHTCSIIKRNYLKSETFDNFLKIIAYQPKGNAPELDLPLLPEIVVEDDVEKLADHNWNLHKELFSEKSKSSFLSIFKTGYKAANKKYSEEDLINGILYGMKKGLDINKVDENDPDWVRNYVKSLKQPKQPKWFVAENNYGRCMEERCLNHPCDNKCKELKTTFKNGKTYLVGKYEY